MNDMQFWAAMLVLFLAGLFCLHRVWTSWMALKAGGCSSSCSCERSVTIKMKKPGLVTEDDLTARLRTR